MLFEKLEQKIALSDTPKPSDDFHQAIVFAFNQLIKIEIAFDFHYITVQFKVYTQSFFDTAKYIIFRPQNTMACFAMLGTEPPGDRPRAGFARYSIPVLLSPRQTIQSSRAPWNLRPASLVRGSSEKMLRSPWS